MKSGLPAEDVSGTPSRCSAWPHEPASSRQHTACVDSPESRLTSSTTSRSVPPGASDRNDLETRGARGRARAASLTFFGSLSMSFLTGSSTTSCRFA